jgi:hypothetical protein
MRDAREQREIGLRDAERLVGAIGLAPRHDLLAANADDARDATARVDRTTQPVEGRRIVVMDAPAGEVLVGIAGPGNLVRLGEGDGFVEVFHGRHGSGLSGRTFSPAVRTPRATEKPPVRQTLGDGTQAAMKLS